MSTQLKILRKKLGLSLESLAQACGLTRSYLSKVERGLAMPSIAAGLKLAKALNVRVEELFTEESDTPLQGGYSLMREQDRRPWGADGQASAYAVLAHQVGRRNVLPFMVHPPQEFRGSSFKEHQGEEFLFVHEGCVEVDFGSERIILQRGDALQFNAQKPHRVRSCGDQLAHLLVVVEAGQD